MHNKRLPGCHPTHLNHYLLTLAMRQSPTHLRKHKTSVASSGSGLCRFWLPWVWALVLASVSASAQAAYSCNVSATNLAVLYIVGGTTPIDATGSVTLSCTRASGDANTLSYRIKANDGQNPLSVNPFRQVRLGSSATDLLNYSLRRATSAGASATCGLITSWRAPTTGTSNVITGTLSFGGALSASVTWSYCIRMRVGSGGNPSSPTPGVYTDTIGIFAQYPNSDAGALSPVTNAIYSVGVGSQCVQAIPPRAMTLNYTSFSNSAQTSQQTVQISCSNGLAWSAAISPANTSALGLTYNATLSTNSGTGIGASQPLVITVTAPAGQSGTCSTASCQAVTPHVLTITY